MNKKTVAVCGSLKCTGIQIHFLSWKQYVEKKHLNGVCPDCKSAVVWITEGKARRMNAEKKDKTKFEPSNYDLNQR